MHLLKNPAVALALTCVTSVQAHTMLSRLFVNDVSQNDGTCLRVPLSGTVTTLPILDLASPDMVCGINGQNGVARVCPVKAGDKATLEFRWWPEQTQPGFIDAGHHGPCAVYMKKVDSILSDSGAGPGWFKVFQDGYTPSSDKFCTDKLIDSKGLLSITMPTDLQDGYYLVRTEIAALHLTGSPQLFINCAQIYLHSGGSASPSDTVSIPGHIKHSDPLITYTIWNRPFIAPFPQSGPKVYVSSGSGGGGSGPSTNVGPSKGTNGTSDLDLTDYCEDEPPAQQHSLQPRQLPAAQKDGLLPAGAILENGNWVGVEVPRYNDYPSCLASAKNCDEQGTACINIRNPTGNKNCDLWHPKCLAIKADCANAKYDGPANYGKVLTPPVITDHSLPAPTPVVDFGASGTGSSLGFTPSATTSATASPVVRRRVRV